MPDSLPSLLARWAELAPDECEPFYRRGAARSRFVTIEPGEVPAWYTFPGPDLVADVHRDGTLGADAHAATLAAALYSLIRADALPLHLAMPDRSPAEAEASDGAMPRADLSEPFTRGDGAGGLRALATTVVRYRVALLNPDYLLR